MLEVKNLRQLFFAVDLLKMPSYQRAYTWQKEQIDQFISDLLEIKGKGEYYYGHFILEETDHGIYEIIDGQQRLTTFILFLIVCNSLEETVYKEFIQKFETVDYDEEAFKIIKRQYNAETSNWKIEQSDFSNKHSVSIARILYALNRFQNYFLTYKLSVDEIKDYLDLLLDAHISVHTTKSKAVAVQIFELHNTRGVKLTLLEKIKSKLIKAVYLTSFDSNAELAVGEIQEQFAEIYKLEETSSQINYIGDLDLEHILFCHLKVVDDGTKLVSINKEPYETPSDWGDREANIINYLDRKIVNHQGKDLTKYITELVKRFRMSVELARTKLPKLDCSNSIVGDVLIMDRNLSLQFLLLLYHIDESLPFATENNLRLWERLLFTRDFHDKYYQMKYRDDFPKLFLDISQGKNLNETLAHYVNEGFRPELMVERKLSTTVTNYINANKGMILNNAFHWWNGKMVYMIYKYEIQQGCNLKELREIIKLGRSVDHILPQEWNIAWINQNNANEKDVDSNQFIENVRNVINGIGNLLLITGNENSSHRNKHPNEKVYRCCSGGSYALHNDNREKWLACQNWIPLINDRGEKMLHFIQEFVSGDIAG